MSEHAISNAKAWLETVRELATRLENEDDADDDTSEKAREEAQDAPLSVEVRDGWRMPGETPVGAAEYRILLTTGGPALQIVGDLVDGEPDDFPELQWQDWGTPWTPLPLEEEDRQALYAFVRVFCFGEG